MFFHFLVDSIKQKVIIMKNNVLLICVCLFIFSCTNNSKEENNSPMFSFESTGGVDLGNKKIYIQENDTSYHISEIWDGMENFFTGFHYFYLNDSFRCAPDWHSKQRHVSYIIWILVFGFVIPTIIIVISTVITFINMHKVMFWARIFGKKYL